MESRPIQGIPGGVARGSIPGRIAANMEILESWYIPGVGQRRSVVESRPIPGDSRWCSAWLNSREDSGVDPKRGAVCSREDSRRYGVLSYTSGAAGGSGVI